MHDTGCNTVSYTLYSTPKMASLKPNTAPQHPHNPGMLTRAAKGRAWVVDECQDLLLAQVCCALGPSDGDGHGVTLLLHLQSTERYSPTLDQHMSHLVLIQSALVPCCDRGLVVTP
jgi:hypothetical protein